MRKEIIKYVIIGTSAALCLVPLIHSNSLSQSTNSQPTTESGETEKTAESKAVAKTDASAVKPNWQFQDEQEWIVDEIGRDIAEMLAYAKYHNDPKADYSTASWEPATYAPFAAWLEDKLQLKPESKSQLPPADYVKTLADANMSTLFAENRRISGALSATPLDPSLHEQAALLQATIDMLELAGNFSDTRYPLNRMAAHLAIVHSLNGDSKLTTIGKLADISLESMSCRDGIAVKKNDLAAKSETDPIVLSFLRALKIRSSGNFQLFDSAHQTPLEATQFGLRNINYLSADKMLAYIAEHNCSPAIQWRRIARACQSSVGAGHDVAANAVQEEIDDFRKDYELYNGRQFVEQSDLTAELDKTPTRCVVRVNDKPSLVVLSWDDMAASHARNIASAGDTAYVFNDRRYGVPEIAEEVERNDEKLFGKARIFPMTLLSVDVDKHKDLATKLFSGMKDMIDKHPETITMDAWLRAANSAKNNKSEIVLAQPELWFSPAMPVGTAFYFAHRQHLKNCKKDLETLTKLREICPLDSSICAAWAARKFGKKPTSTQLREAYGSLADFNVQVMSTIADADYDEPSKYIPQEEKIAKIRPNEYFDLAQYCALNNKEEMASTYFQRGIEESEDSVSAANHSKWLVNYLFDHGQKDKALAYAENAAEVYSFRGLETLADLYDRMGDLTKAEETWLKVPARYPGDHSREYLGGFYLRNASKDKRYADEANRLLPGYFPAGLQRFELSQLKAPPEAGLLITSTDPYPEKFGLKKGFVIVGLNGYKTDNQKQYGIVRVMSLSPIVRIAYWDGTKYQDVIIKTVDENRVYVNFKDYNAVATSTEPLKKSDSSPK